MTLSAKEFGMLSINLVTVVVFPCLLKPRQSDLLSNWTLEHDRGKSNILINYFSFASYHVAGIDEKGPQLFHMDPSGTFVQYDAKAIGSGSEGAQQSLKVSCLGNYEQSHQAIIPIHKLLIHLYLHLMANSTGNSMVLCNFWVCSIFNMTIVLQD